MRLSPLPARLTDPMLALTDIYCRGDAALLDAPAVAIVGSRDASPDALVFAGHLARAVVRAGLVIVSGGARGIDFAAHDTALRMGYGRLVCVLGSPLDPISPAVSARVCDRVVAAGGAVVSEHPSGVETFKGFFRERNRIIAALADLTIVAAARFGSGSLHTARYARELGKPVWAVPGAPWDGRMQGGNALIAAWKASPIASLGTCEKALRVMFGVSARSKAPSRDRIEALLAGRAHSADELCAALVLPPERLPSVIYEHLRSGRIVRGPDGKYRLV